MNLANRFQLHGPLIVAPLGGGPTTPELVIATCEAGALGSLAGAYLTAEQIDQAVSEIKKKTSRAFAINLFVPMPKLEISATQIANALQATRKFRDELGLKDPELKSPYHHDFDSQFAAVLRARPQVFSFVFGNLDARYIDECRKHGIFTMGTATSVEEALLLEKSGVDAVIAQGFEAGGHRGIFNSETSDPETTALDLVRTLKTNLKIPIVAAGGMMNGSDIRKSVEAGAELAMLGTAFLLCPEAGTSKAYRSALQTKASPELTRVFSGRLARGIRNRLMRELDPKSVLPFPAQNAFTRDIRVKSASMNNPDFLSLWSGTGLAKIREMPAGELVHTLLFELSSS